MSTTTQPTPAAYEIPPGTFDDRDQACEHWLQIWEDELRAREAHLREQEHLAALRQQRLAARERDLALREGLRPGEAGKHPLTGYLANRFLTPA